MLGQGQWVDKDPTLSDSYYQTSILAYRSKARPSHITDFNNKFHYHQCVIAVMILELPIAMSIIPGG